MVPEVCHDEAFEISLDLHIFDQSSNQSLSVQSSGLKGLASCRQNIYFFFLNRYCFPKDIYLLCVIPMMRNLLNKKIEYQSQGILSFTQSKLFCA